MNSYLYVLLIVFAVIAYMIIEDANVATYIILLGKMVNLWVARLIFKIKFLPRLYYDTWLMKRGIVPKKYEKMVDSIKDPGVESSGD